MPEDRTAPQRVYYLEGYVRIVASSDEEAEHKFEQAGLGCAIEDPNVKGVMLDFQGPWDEIADVESVGECICPPDLLARGGFRGGCPVHA
jgi:hypothetical protein